MNIRCEQPSDYSAIAQVNIQAFQQENEARLVEKIRHSERYIPELSLVAEVDEVVVGYILFSYIDLVGNQHFQVLGLAPLAVLPNFQRQGIGSALVEAGLAKAEEMGCAIAIVLGYPEFYSRFGFEPSIHYGIESPFPVPKNAFMVKPLKDYHRKYRGKVVYPLAFRGV
ncbi:MAG: N-acetyltransferase [Crinalium sp.]